MTQNNNKEWTKLTAFLIDADLTSQDDTTLLSAAHFDYCRSPIPLIAACPEDIGIEDVPMTEKQPKGDKN